MLKRVHGSWLAAVFVCRQCRNGDCGRLQRRSWKVDASHGTFSEQIPSWSLLSRDHAEPRARVRLVRRATAGSASAGASTASARIERASPGKGAPKYNATDIYLLDGEELVPCVAGSVSPSCTTGGTHSTKTENYCEIALTGTGTASRWTVTAKDGTRQRLRADLPRERGTDGLQVGPQPGHRHEATTPSPTPGRRTSSAAAGSIPHSVTLQRHDRQVLLRAAHRHDEQGAVGVGDPQRATAASRRSTSTTSGSRVRAYKLTYTTSGATSRSLLASVQQFGKNATLDGTGTVTGGTSLPAIADRLPERSTPTFVGGQHRQRHEQRDGRDATSRWTSTATARPTCSRL